ncbi:MAG TPA: prolyl oligopeptidase family serine peptidase [Chthoniobacterales bacterium]|nr:prolyl oligopeptidase family serine peptidase [Chthoniobacterales bacterium]
MRSTHPNRLLIVAASVFFLGAAILPAATEPSFDYEKGKPIDLQETASRQEGDVTLRDVTYLALDGHRNGATVVSGKTANSNRPAILFVHWYGPPASTSNRTQFIPDAIELAQSGAISLLIDTPWSDPAYFEQRARAGDLARSIQEVKELRRALDVLLAQPGVDPERVAYVGHDFGAMYGALAAASDARVRAFVFMAGTRSFSDWFLYGKPKLTGEARERFVAELAPLDPIRYLPKLAMPLLLQFADHDVHVPKERADALAAAAPATKTVLTYSAEHELNEQATRDRIAWLKKQLKMAPK